ncbi:hypothetical protein CAPTEDRAFT_209743 [Capitella teleta]|uniref:FAD-binding PCMH-type domain-containing protein n=1 Tax=Capitella teleta TaxID=283909 RepID=R7TRM7_CAPTE|nr:hypothetical protein CAPTEDRAFT_209743 [Capitella teleta]|eukprot:ELT96232.1 hypothetical protein CAPTEDRAFT_209743 [Capitella teleta]
MQAVISPRTNVQFKINGVAYTIDETTDPSTMLSDFIRDVALLKGTKIMCREGGCGSCVVTADIPDLTTMKRKTVAVNSCLCSVYSCDDWLITTTEGIGDSRSGLHPIQTRLARYNGSQCGFCSPGMVMNMHSLLQNNSKPTKKEVEDSFDGHICRCTGYRSILDAMCSFADDISPCVDIEDLVLPSCSPRDSLLLMPRGAPWFRPNSLQVLFDILGKSQFKQIALVVGNTSTGYLKNAVTYDAYIDTTAIQDLYSIEVSSVLTFGANVSLTKMIEVMDQSASQKGFEYLIKVTQHLRKVANTSVRNVACWAGNLMLKHTESMFPSDVFLLFAALGVNIKIQSSSSTASYSMEDFMTLDMKGKVILSADFPKLSTDYKFRSYKISPRLQSCLVVPKEAKYEVFPTSQWPDLTQQTVAQVLGIKKNQLINPELFIYFHYTVFISGPVKMHMNFNTNMEMIGRRFPWLADYEVGVDNDGRLIGVKITIYADAGCSPNDHSLFPARFSDNGYLPGIYIMESIMEDIARKLGKDPIDVRRINFYQKGQKNIAGDILNYCNVEKLLGDFLVWADINDRKKSIEKFNKENQWKKQGLSVVPIRYAIRWTGACFSAIVSIYIGDGSVTVTTGGVEMGQGLHTKSAAQYQTYGVSSAEVELDILTGQSQINRVDMTYDCAISSINPKLDIGQAQGAFIMGLGYWLTEEIKYDRITGKNINNSTWGYHPPLPKDIPVDFRIRFLKDAPNPDGVLGSKAVGEPPQCMSVCAPFALRKAVEAARLEIGQHDDFAHDSPYTVEKTHQLCLPDITQCVLK